MCKSFSLLKFAHRTPVYCHNGGINETLQVVPFKLHNTVYSRPVARQGTEEGRDSQDAKIFQWARYTKVHCGDGIFYFHFIFLGLGLIFSRGASPVPFSLDFAKSFPAKSFPSLLFLTLQCQSQVAPSLV